MPTRLTDAAFWQKICETDWNFFQVREHFKHPQTQYLGRPILYHYTEIFTAGILQPYGDTYLLRLPGRCHYQLVERRQIYSVVESTLTKLQENLAADTSDPAAVYTREQISHYSALSDKSQCGFYALYFDRRGEFTSLVHFPELPVWKLALTCSSGPLLRDRGYQCSWYQLRSSFNNFHLLVAGASVAAAAAHALIRDGRPGALTIGDPKPPNATNFNRTTYDVWDIADGESKAICFARQVHAQDPTQILYLAPQGFTADNFTAYFTSPLTKGPVDLMVEAVDQLEQKIDILKIARAHGLPIIQIADVGSKAMLSVNNSSDVATGKSLMFGVSDQRLAVLIKQNLIQAAAELLGLDNVLADEAGHFVREKNQTPFTAVVPQLGSTAQVAAGLLSEQAWRFLLNRGQRSEFSFRRVIIDKKNCYLKIQHWPTVKSLLLTLALSLRKNQGKSAAPTQS